MGTMSKKNVRGAFGRHKIKTPSPIDERIQELKDSGKLEIYRSILNVHKNHVKVAQALRQGENPEKMLYESYSLKGGDAQ